MERIIFAPFWFFDRAAPMKGTNPIVPQSEQYSAEFFRMITSVVPALIYVCRNDERYTMLFTNERAETITGYTREQMLSPGFSFMAHVHQEDRMQVRQAVNEAIREGKWYTLRYRFLHASGDWVWLKEVGTHFKEGGPDTLAGYIENITPMALKVRQLLSHEAYLNNLLESSSDLVVYSLDVDLNYIRFNKKHKTLMRALYGVDVEEGMNILNVLSDKKQKREARENYGRALQGENLILIEKFEDEDIGIRYWENNLTPLRNEVGEIIGLTVFSRDVTQEKSQEEEIAYNETLLRSIADNVSEAMLRYSGTSGFVFANESFYKMFRIVDRQMIYDNFDYQQILSNPAEMAFINERIQSGGQISNYPMLLKRADGTHFWGSINIRASKDWTRDLVFDISISDISDEMAAKRKLFRSEELLVATNAFANDLFGGETFEKGVNRALRTLGESLSVDRTYIFQFRKAGEQYFASEMFEWSVEGITSQIDNPRLQDFNVRDFGFDRWLWLMLQHQPVVGHVKDFPEIEQKALNVQGIKSLAALPIYIEKELWGFIGFDDCKAHRTWDVFEIETLRNVANTIASAVRIKHDIEELDAAREKALELSRLKSGFLANMSHEIRTPLNGIIGLADIMLDEFKDNADLLNYITILKESSDRLLKTITTILNFSRLESSEQEIRLSKTDLCKELHALRHTFDALVRKKDITLNYHLLVDKAYVVVDQNVLHQILNNLIGNAIKFTNEGEINVYVNRKHGANGDSVYCTVADTGIGIQKEFLPRVFDPFAQESEGLSRQFQGTGLGLSIVKKYIEMFGGDIIVESEKGKGSAFTFWLPAL